MSNHYLLMMYLVLVAQPKSLDAPTTKEPFMFSRILAPAILCLLFIPNAGLAQRVVDQLNTQFTFSQGSGSIIMDEVDLLPRVSLVVNDVSKIGWSVDHLNVTGDVLIESDAPSTKIINGVVDALTLEAWVAPLNITQVGPARILSLSHNGYPDGGNFVIGQDASSVTVRLRTTTSDQYGNPSLDAPNVFEANTLIHIIFTRTAGGVTSLYINGALVNTGLSTGDLSNWGDYTLTIAGESEATRFFHGAYYLVAVYSKALDQNEVMRNFAAGPTEVVPPDNANPDATINARCSWDAPTYGTPVVKYIVQHSIDGGAWYDYALTDGSTTLNMTINFWVRHRVRVAGIDANDRQGPYSDSSEIYAPADSLPHPPYPPVRVE